MKNKYPLLFFLFAQLCFSQQLSINGKVLDNITKEPIYGVALLINDNMVCFSDIDGSFNFDIELKETNPNIQFQHLSYKSLIMSYDEIYNANKIILLNENVSTLNEVVISASKSNKTIKDILKVAKEKFDETNRETPYWSGLNYKQLIYLNGIPHSYLEFNGHIFMVGNVNNPFVDPIVVPEQIRRTKESKEIIKSWFSNSEKSDFFKSQLGQSEATHGWTDYRFLESVHPLGKKTNSYYDFELIGVDDNYYKISFKQKKQMTIATRWLEHVQGEFLVNKSDFVLFNLRVNYRFEQIYYVSLNIDYKLIEGRLYPYTVEKNRFAFKSFNNKQTKVVLNSFSNFKSINTIERENYRKDFVFGPWYSISKFYDQKYWKSNPTYNVKYYNALQEIIGDFDENIIFTDGANTKEYNSNISDSSINSMEEKAAELKKIMNRDLKQ